MPAARGMPAPVLHGAWVLAREGEPAGFAIWGEEPLSPRGRPLTTRKRKQLPRRPPPHPFALTDDGIRHALSVLGLTTWATQGSVRQVVACLPSTEAGPHRSTDPVEPPDANQQRLDAWDVPAVVLDEVAAVVLLPRIAAASATRPTMLGDDLRAWIVAARFALSLLARQRFLPRAQPPDRSGEGPDLIVARWSPVVDEPADLANVRALERAIPPAGLSLAWETGGERPTAREVVADFVAAVVDGVARRARPPLPPQDKSRKPGPADAWLTALASDDCLVHLPEDVGEALRRQIGAWSAVDEAVATDADAAFRLCFRLSPPLSPDGGEKEKKPWR